MALRRRFQDSKLVGSEETVGGELITRDASDVEIARRPLTDAEIAIDVAKDQPMPDQVLVGDIEAASTIADIKAAIVKRFGD